MSKPKTAKFGPFRRAFIKGSIKYHARHKNATEGRKNAKLTGLMQK